MEDPSGHDGTPRDGSNDFDEVMTLIRMNQANLTNNVGRSLPAMLGALTYSSIYYLAELQRSIRDYGPALSKLFRDVTAWIRANPYKAIGILGGSTLLVLALASPMILGAVGFGPLGPVAGSIATAWQASMGLVPAESLFAFLQSAAMGGPAMGFFVGIGALGGTLVLGTGLTSLRDVLGGLVQKFKEPVVKKAEECVRAVGGLVENSKEPVVKIAENCMRAMGQGVDEVKGAMGGLANNFMAFFGKLKDD